MIPSNTPAQPSVFLVGGPDIDARLELMRLLQTDFRLSAVGTDPTLGELFRTNNFTYYSYALNRGTNPFADLRYFFSLFSLFKRHRPLLVHTFDTKPCVYARLAARFAGVPVVIGTIPGLGLLYSSNGMRNRLLRLIYQPLQRLSCHLSDLTVFQLSSDSDHFIRKGIAPQNKTFVIPGSGVNTSLFDSSNFSQSTRERVRIELGIPNEAILVIMISRLIRSKGVLDFSAAAGLLSQTPNIHFVLVGPLDEGNPDCLTSSEIKTLTQSLQWLGNRSDVPELLAASDIFAFPTSYAEGLPRVILEAAASTLPIIASDIPGCRAIITDGENGMITPVHNPTALAQAIITLSVNPSLRKHLGESARHRVIAEFNISAVTSLTRHIYRDLLASKN